MQEITNECEKCEFKCVSDSENKKNNKKLYIIYTTKLKSCLAVSKF